MSVLVCFALKEEAAPFLKIAAGKSGVAILIVGIGRENAEKSIREFLAANSPEAVFTCGFAGGLNAELKLGDVVFEVGFQESESRTTSPRPSPHLAPLPLPNAEREKRSQPRSVSTPLASLIVGSYKDLVAAGAKPVQFFCADRIATTVAEKRKLREETGADAVEMESAAIHAVCRERNIPCVTVRVISDTANEDLPLDFNALARPDKSLDFGKLAWAIAKSPGKIGALMELQKKTSFAAKRLAAVLERVVLNSNQAPPKD